jgi:hypothetical protein
MTHHEPGSAETAGGDRRPGQPRHSTRLTEHLKNGEIEIVTDDAQVEKRAQEARLNDDIGGFVYWNGNEYEKVTGRVTSIRRGKNNVRFSVMPGEE